MGTSCSRCWRNAWTWSVAPLLPRGPSQDAGCAWRSKIACLLERFGKGVVGGLEALLGGGLLGQDLGHMVSELYKELVGLGDCGEWMALRQNLLQGREVLADLDILGIIERAGTRRLTLVLDEGPHHLGACRIGNVLGGLLLLLAPAGNHISLSAEVRRCRMVAAAGRDGGLDVARRAGALDIGQV